MLTECVNGATKKMIIKSWQNWEQRRISFLQLRLQHFEGYLARLTESLICVAKKIRLKYYMKIYNY